MTFSNFYESMVWEKKMSIQRFSGSNEMSDAELLTFLHQLQQVAADGTIDLSTNDKVSMSEKFDGSPANWGHNPEWFMESANSGEVTNSNIEKFNNPYTVHFYQAFKFLADYGPFQERLKKAADYAGAPIKFISEMFPVLTHKGDQMGDFIFCSTKYNKSKLGNKGAFMIFDVKVKEGDSWIEPSEDIKGMLLDIIRSPDDPEWKCFYIERDGKLNGNLQFDFAGINDWISSPEKLAQSVAVLRKKNDPNSKTLKDLIAKIRPGLQKQLDAYAEKTSSSLGNATGKSPIEGVVLKVNLPDGPTFIKGTSQIFHDIAAGTWGTRKELGAIEKTLTGQFLKDVIGLRTDQPAALNRAIAEVGKEFHSNKQGEELVNDFANELRKKLMADGAAGDANASRKKAQAYMKAAAKQLADIEKKWQQTKTQVDPDTVDKTENQMKYTKEMLTKLQARVVDAKYSGDAYMVYLLRMLIGRRIEGFINKEAPGGEIDELAGGRAEGMSLDDIAQKQDVPEKDLEIQFAKGVPDEMEHTDDPVIAGEITKDHLAGENPEYYSDMEDAGIDEAELDELDVSNILSRVKQMMGKKQAQDPAMRDIDDDLPAEPQHAQPSLSANDALHDNLPDQDPEWLPVTVRNFIAQKLVDKNLPEVEINRIMKAYDSNPEKILPKITKHFKFDVNDIRAVAQGHDEDPEKERQRNVDRALDYVHGHTDELWEESAEEFEEDEILDERKFEKVKMARNTLSKLGYPKAFERDHKGKYILRSKHIRKLMKKLGYTFIDEKGRWIMDPKEPEVKDDMAAPVDINTTPDVAPEPEQQAQGKRAIVWIGRAQPWHKGHDTLIQQGLSKLGEVGADMVFIMLVKGAGTAEDKTKNPMDFNAQAELIGAVYANEQKVDVSSLPVPTGSIVDILVVASKQGVVVKGWLAGSDRIAGYKAQFAAFKTDKYKAEFEQKTAPGTPYPVDGDIAFIDGGREAGDAAPKPRDKAGKAAAAAEKATKDDMLAAKAKTSETPVIPVPQMSGTLARMLVSKLDFQHWFKEVCPQKYLGASEASAGYQQAYDILGGGASSQPEVKEAVYESIDNLRNNLKSIFEG